MELIGKPPINPILFYTGKIAGYFCWFVLITSILDLHLVEASNIEVLSTLSLILAFTGGILVIISLLNLGRSTRLALPSEKTRLKTSGLYKYSRNPMYVGFNIFTIAAIFYTLNIYISVLGIYSLITYHFIILGEEKFLKQRFGEAYKLYTRKVRRYF